MNSNIPISSTIDASSSDIHIPTQASAPTVQVVTQSSQLSQECLTLPSPQSNPSEQSQQQHDSEDCWIMDHAITNTTPIIEPSTIPRFPTPTVASPDTSKRHLQFVMDNNALQNREIATAARSMVALSNASNQKRWNPQTGLFMFLRYDDIDLETKLMESKGLVKFDYAKTLQLAKKSWKPPKAKQSVHANLKPFKLYTDLQVDNGLLGRYALGRTHNRLLLEDIMVTKAPEKMVLLIHQDHPFVSGKNSTWWSRRIVTIGEKLSSDRLNYVLYQKNLYWALKVTIVANAEMPSLTSDQYTELEIKRGCTQKGGWGLRVETANGDQTNLLFHQLIDKPIQLQLWSEERTTNYRKLKEKLRRYSNNISLAAAVKRLLKETYGDSVFTQDLCQRYSTILRDRAKKGLKNSGAVGIRDAPSGQPPRKKRKVEDLDNDLAAMIHDEGNEGIDDINANGDGNDNGNARSRGCGG